jgi:putative isomerase
METLRPGRRWNTWDPVHPAELVHLPSGTHLAVTLYSDALGRMTRLPPGHRHGVLLGPRTMDSGHIALEVEHGGTRLAITVEACGDDAVTIGWKTLAHGEWGLRFWLNLCLWREDGTPVRYDPESTELSLGEGAGHVVAKGPCFPLMATFHEDMAALEREFAEHGYFYLASRGTEGPFGVLRYNLEEMAEFTVAVAWAEDRAAAAAACDAVLAAGSGSAFEPWHTGFMAGALDAVRDCVAWGTVWDRHNRRIYTQQSRNWIAQKFGGWGVWLNDSVYHGHLAGLVDPDVAHENQRAIFAGSTEWGNLPCLLTGNDSWVDRTQPPVAGLITWMHYLRSRDRAFLEEGWPALKANHDWWWRERDGNGNGLLEYGTSPVGDGLYRGTKLAAKDESMMDNSPVHDEARLVPETNTLDCEDIALNSLLAVDGEVLALMAAELGRDDAARDLAARSDGLKARIGEDLWDAERGVFANRLWSGKFADSLAPTSFFPLVCGAASREQADMLVERTLLNDDAFWGPWPVPSVSRSDPAFADNVYWRGRTWPPLNFLTYLGLRRYGYDKAAADLAGRCHALFMLNWSEERICGENFSAVTGRADDQPDTDLFYTWGALLEAIAVAEISDVNPWQGWTLNNTGQDVTLHGLATPIGRARVAVTEGRLSVAGDEGVLFETDARGRMCHVAFSASKRAVTLPPQGRAIGVRLPDLPVERLKRASLEGAPIQPQDGSYLEFHLPAGSGGNLLVDLQD